jgi:NifU-like protein
MSREENIEEIKKQIKEKIRPMLVMDGGNMEVIDIKDEDEFINVYIRYLGACYGCASGSTGTLFAIESMLQEKIASNIRVLPI